MLSCGSQDSAAELIGMSSLDIGIWVHPKTGNSWRTPFVERVSPSSGKGVSTKSGGCGKGFLTWSRFASVTRNCLADARVGHYQANGGGSRVASQSVRAAGSSACADASDKSQQYRLRDWPLAPGSHASLPHRHWRWIVPVSGCWTTAGQCLNVRSCTSGVRGALTRATSERLTNTRATSLNCSGSKW